MKKVLVLTALLVLVMSTAALAAIGAPPQSTEVQINVEVKPWVRVTTDVSAANIVINPAESGGFADFNALVRGNIAYTVTGKFSYQAPADGISLDFSFPDETGVLPVADDGIFYSTTIQSRDFDYQYAQNVLPVRVAAHGLDLKSDTYAAGTLELTIAAQDNI